MTAKRLTRRFIEVVAEVRQHIIDNNLATREQLDAWSTRAAQLQQRFPSSGMISIDNLWIDYEVQRDVIYKHVINIMKNWDPRICGPGSACRLVNDSRTMLYDAQHRSLAAALLGYESVPCAVVETNDPNFASYAFEMLNNSGVKRLTPGDLHRNALVRYKNGSREKKVVLARTMQNQFDAAGIDLQDKNSRSSPSLRGSHRHFFSHFKYAHKGIEVDPSGRVLLEILQAICNAFPNQEEIDQGLFIGLLELHKLSSAEAAALPKGWMSILLESIKTVFDSSHVIHAKAKSQWDYVRPGATWSAPEAVSNFLRELHIYAGGRLALPYHGIGSKIGIEEGNIAPGLIPKLAA